MVLKDGHATAAWCVRDLQDPYSGRAIAFVRGQDTSSAVQIDHVVALSDAWQKGAQQWDTATRGRSPTTRCNLLAVDGPLNQQKGDGDAATWLPPNKAYRCAYVARQVGVKYTYGLWVTQAEHDAMVRVLSTCPNEPLPTGSVPPRSPSRRLSTPAAPAVVAGPVRELQPRPGPPAPLRCTWATPGTRPHSTATVTASGARSAPDRRRATPRPLR